MEGCSCVQSMIPICCTIWISEPYQGPGVRDWEGQVKIANPVCTRRDKARKKHDGRPNTTTTVTTLLSPLPFEARAQNARLHITHSPPSPLSPLPPLQHSSSSLLPPPHPLPSSRHRQRQPPRRKRLHLGRALPRHRPQRDQHVSQAAQRDEPRVERHARGRGAQVEREVQVRAFGMVEPVSFAFCLVECCFLWRLDGLL